MTICQQQVIDTANGTSPHDLRLRLRNLAQHTLHCAANGNPVEGIIRDLSADIWELNRAADAGKSRDKFTYRDLLALHPRLKEPVINGLARIGEVLNIIANSKVGKSWLAYYIALCIINGRALFGRFDTSPGGVLIIDNELHACTLAHRIRVVAEAMALAPSDYEDDLHVMTLRGKLRGVHDLADQLETEVEPGAYKAILWDALYRFNIAGVSENDNAAMAAMYNTMDRIAEQTQAVQLLIHHATKGNQSDKRITDVGAGAGAQSRAADCHLILREHESPGVVVLEAAVRSFAPVSPMALRWTFPLWLPADDIDPARLKGRLTQSEQRQSDRDRQGINKIVNALRDGHATARQLRAKTGLGKDRQQRLLDWMESEGHVKAGDRTIRGNPTREYTLAE
jgi:hypothetical protein